MQADHVMYPSMYPMHPLENLMRPGVHHTPSLTTTGLKNKRSCLINLLVFFLGTNKNWGNHNPVMLFLKSLLQCTTGTS